MSNPATFQLPPEGVYAAQITAAQPAVSKNQNEMLVTDFQLLPKDGVVRGWLVLSDVARFRLQAFCVSFQILPPGDPGALLYLTPEHCLGRYGFLRIKHQTWKGRQVAKIDRFLSRLVAIRENPALQEVVFPSQKPLPLAPPAVIATASSGEPDDLPF
jgi:hypothetical protein